MAEQNLLSVMDAIEKAGSNGVGGFLDALRVSLSQDGSMKRRVSTLVENQLSNIVMKLLQHARFGRQTERNQPLVAVLPACMPNCQAPNLWSVFCQLCKIDERTAEAYFESDTPHVMVQVEDPHAPEDEQGAQHKQKGRFRQKALSVVLMMGLTTFCRSRESNVLQTMIGFYLFSTSTGKRVMGVFDHWHLGICISYDAVREALRNNAQKVRTELCARAAFRWTADLAYIRQPNQQKQRCE
jgi:hypothetical protein